MPETVVALRGSPQALAPQGDIEVAGLTVETE